MNLDLARAYAEETVATRREIHRHPELSGCERRTSQLVADRLTALGIPCVRHDDYCVIGLIDSGRPGPTIALRCDMDALPIAEETGLPFSSTVAGVAHLCGHDGHTAALLTAARLLMDGRHGLRGRVRLIFQPSEEGPPGGARAMVAHGAMEGVDAIFGLHFTGSLETGCISVEPGCRMAASLRCRIDVLGRGGHGGMPHDTVDAVVAASAIVMNLQTLASREINPAEPLAVTVGILNGGTAFNAVSGRAHMEASIKYFNDSLTEPIRSGVTRIATSTAAAFRAGCDVCIDGHCAPVVNDSALAALAHRTAAELVGQKGVCAMAPMAASEDFSVYLEHAPGLFAFVGCRKPGSVHAHPLHHPGFTLDEDALTVAATLYGRFAMDYLLAE